MEMVCGECAARISASACSRAALLVIQCSAAVRLRPAVGRAVGLPPELAQVVPGVDAGGVPVAPLDLHRIAAHLVHALGPDLRLHLLVAHHALAAPLLDALRAGTARAQPSGRELRLPPVVPTDEQVALRIEGEVGWLGLRRLRLELVEEAHGGLVTRSGMQRAMLRSSSVFRAVALPYELLTRHPVWERQCARM